MESLLWQTPVEVKTITVVPLMGRIGEVHEVHESDGLPDHI